MGTVAMGHRRRGGRSALGLIGRNPDFARLWAGETVSAVGSRITALALPLVAIERLGAGPAQLGVLNAVQTLPYLLLALVAGVVVDRMRRRPILIAANVGRGLLLAAIPALALADSMRIWHLYAVGLGVGACAVFFEVAYQSFLPRIVAPADLGEANSKVTASDSVAEIGGPGLAGALVGIVGAPVAIALDAASFLWSAVNLGRVRAAEPASAPRGDGVGLRTEIAEGFRVTLHNRYLLAFAGEAATYNVAWNAMSAVLVLWAVREVGLGVGTLGLVLSVGAVGALVGALASGSIARRLGVGPAMIGCAVVSNLGVLIIPLAAVAPAPAAVLAAGVFVQGFGGTGTNVQTYAIRQAVVADAVMGRVTAVYRVLTYGFIPAGAVIGGALGEVIGLQAALWVGAVALFPSWLWLACSPARRLRELPSPPTG